MYDNSSPHLSGNWSKCSYKSYVYYVSDEGQVYSTRFRRLIKARIDRDGYECLNVKKKQFFVHRLVMQAFKQDEHFEGAVVKHLDYDRTNNKLSNLRWGKRGNEI